MHCLAREFTAVSIPQLVEVKMDTSTLSSSLSSPCPKRVRAQDLSLTESEKQFEVALSPIGMVVEESTTSTAGNSAFPVFFLPFSCLSCLALCVLRLRHVKKTYILRAGARSIRPVIRSGVNGFAARCRSGTAATTKSALGMNARRSALALRSATVGGLQEASKAIVRHRDSKRHVLRGEGS